ncbi:DUF3344 domain-containing protein [Streptomyces sp. 549]|uniref:DUF3344 domain-containing protein n=1 Tax=Streptomyces sp. 549 TaxID=3049076 RepID=UPI0024C452C3|nr:DUF3344 domain-containing protein [Streptomyces sp. 549]MDK1473576.1 DUF3344 domain-containing protein [Streptomyces sp. 549]
MRMPRGLAGRAALCALTVVTASAVLPAAAAPKAAVSAQVPFEERYRAVQHGGIVRAANSSITCRTTVTRGARTCPDARRGAGVNGDYEMFYIDVDDDPLTYNSSQAELRVPKGSRVSWARLYWGGNLRVGEQKPPADNGRVLLAEPGGQYKEVLADRVIGHRTSTTDDAFQASADVTELVRDSAPGYWTVAQVNVAMGHSAAGAWGGWTLVAAYENPREPLRRLAVWDGFQTLHANRRNLSVTLDAPGIPAGAAGSAGFVAYNGDRGKKGDTLSVRADGRKAVRLYDTANAADDVMNSTISEYGRHARNRKPAYMNTLGYDADVFDIKPALKQGGDRLTFRFGSGADGYHAGVLFLQVDARR